MKWTIIVDFKRYKDLGVDLMNPVTAIQTGPITVSMNTSSSTLLSGKIHCIQGGQYQITSSTLSSLSEWTYVI